MHLAIPPGSTSLMERDRVSSLCTSWLLQQRSSSLLVAPGTTFPPLKQHLPYFKEQLERFATAQQEGRGSDSNRHSKCLSEPDLSHDLEDDDDYLFEFDIGSPADSPKEDLGSEEEQMKVVNVVEDYEEAMQQFPRRFSISSDTCSTCSSSKETYREDVREGNQSSLAWSTSSGFGGRMGSSQEIEKDMVDRLEGMSVEPEMWKQSCALYLGVRGEGSGGSGTAAQISSPKMDSSLSPLVSPDSLLEEEIQPSRNYCCECSQQEVVEGLQAVDQERLLKQERLGGDKGIFRTETDESNSKETAIIRQDTGSEQEKTSREKGEREKETNISERSGSEETLGRSVRVKFVVGEEEEVDVRNSSSTVEINSNLVVSSDKLASLLCQLEDDKHYPSESNTPTLASKEPSPSRVNGDSFQTIQPRQEESDLNEEEDRRPKLRKCSSLKTRRTPPVTPGTRKIVRFADILGLDLSEVKVFSDEIPRIPKAAFNDLDVDPAEYVWPPSPKQQTKMTHHLKQNLTTPNLPATCLLPMFNQPGSTPHFFEKVQREKVVLESAFMEGTDLVSGVVRVLNLSFHKSVTVRWTVNDWSTVSEQAAEYVPGSSSGGMDKFSFRLAAQGTLAVGSRLQFCVKYVSGGTEFWDSNGGSNYLFQVFPNNTSSSPTKKLSSAPQSISSRGGLISSRTFFAAHSPSHHGDDPWLRFM